MIGSEGKFSLRETQLFEVAGTSYFGPDSNACRMTQVGAVQ